MVKYMLLAFKGIKALNWSEVFISTSSTCLVQNVGNVRRLAPLTASSGTEALKKTANDCLAALRNRL